MTKQQYSLDDYVDVPARMQWFFAKYPEGSLQSSIVHLTDSYVVVQAVAYRNPGDLAPGLGHAYEPIPGRTPFTKDSEVMNAETSAWGRALAAIGAPTKEHIASANEVRSRAEGEQTEPATSPVTGRPMSSETTSKPPPGTPKKSCPHPKYEPVPNKPDMERCVRCGTARKAEAPEPIAEPSDPDPERPHLYTERPNPWEK